MAKKNPTKPKATKPAEKPRAHVSPETPPMVLDALAKLDGAILCMLGCLTETPSSGFLHANLAVAARAACDIRSVMQIRDAALAVTGGRS